MRNCKKLKKYFVAFLCGELRDEERALVQTHLDSCPHCRREVKSLEQVLKGAESLTQDIEQAINSVNWNGLPQQIAERAFAEKVIVPREPWLAKLGRFILQPKLKPAYAGILVGVILGSFMTFLFLRGPFQPKAGKRELFAPQSFLEKIELEMARRETLDYLEKSEYLLLDYIQTPAEKSAEFWRSEFASEKARDLLAKKKYINPQLEKFQMSKAKVICDQIEFLFYELTQISIDLSAEELEKVQRMIGDEQILLKINLLKKELKKSEV
jgi:hypothetical protein